MLGDEGDQARRGAGVRLGWWIGNACCPVVPGLEQPGELDQVVGEYAVAAPDASAVDAVHAGAVPAEAVLEAADPPFTAGAPLDQPAEATPVLDQLAGGAGAGPGGGGRPGRAAACRCGRSPAGRREPAAAHRVGCRP